MNQQVGLFSNKALQDMIIPLFLEQLLVMLVGLADTLVISYAGSLSRSEMSVFALSKILE